MKGKGNARARMQAERAARAKKERLYRRLIVSGAVLGGAALLTGVIIAVTGSGSGRTDAAMAAAMKGPLVVPQHASGTDGTVITYGDPAAKRTLDVYEDPRCPFCGIVERGLGATMQRLADDGTYKIQYHVATFLDDSFGGNGSKSALGALGAAVHQGTQQFAALHAALYENQPDEREDSFADRDKLLSIVAKVPGLDQAAMKKAVNDGTYLPWTAKADTAAGKDLDAAWKKAGLSGPAGTPAVFLDGRRLNVIDNARAAISAEEFKGLVAKGK
ncbi:thioredoxin domain-containing protein [Streptomyces sp. NPDC002506]|uniref:thioredoxin domain-containing protein n=1 Tax=Streptomyces sp. NPDC002506 TaxID=3154536 RepID=UPI00332EFE10